MRRSFFVVLIGTLVLSAELPARGAPQSAAQQATKTRLSQLEAETAQLRSEVQWLRDRTVRLPSVEAVPTAAATETLFSEPESSDGDFYTLAELRKEMASLVWKKGEFKIVPYGDLWGSMIYSTDRTFPGAYTLFVPSVTDQGEDTFVIDTRRTRLGLDVDGPRVPFFHCAKSRGRVEIDFQGAFVVENKPGVLLRHAYAEIYDDDFRLLAGQYWDIISPLNPQTVSYSVGWGGGNIGYRRAQVRLERYVTFSDVFKMTLAGSVNQNIVSDFLSTPDIKPEASDWPLIQGRVGVTLGHRGKNDLPITVGVSGHIGEQGFDFINVGPPPGNLPPADDARTRTWSFNVDFHAPITDRFGVQGEFFTGEDLSTFLGGIVQGIDIATRDPIRSTGGWFNVWYDCTPRLHTHAGFGLDDPRDNDFGGGPFQHRLYNHFIFANSIFDLTKKLSVGVEVTSWKTLHLGRRPGESVQFEFSGRYTF